MLAVSQTLNASIHLQLQQLRDQLAAFKTVSCSLMHEQVTSINQESINNNIDIEQLRVTRFGLCDVSKRRSILGCSHTMANDRFTRLVDEVYQTGALKEPSPTLLIKELVLKIYLMDHEKGNLEKQKAIALHQNNKQELSTLENLLRDIVSRHQNLIMEIEKIREDIMQQIDRQIANDSKG